MDGRFERWCGICFSWREEVGGRCATCGNAYMTGNSLPMFYRSTDPPPKPKPSTQEMSDRDRLEDIVVGAHLLLDMIGVQPVHGSLEARIETLAAERDAAHEELRNIGRIAEQNRFPVLARYATQNLPENNTNKEG